MRFGKPVNGQLLGVFLLAAVCIQTGCSFRAAQNYKHFITPTPLPADHYLILGFMGGRERWDNERHGVRRLALKLRARNLPAVAVETVENKQRRLAILLIRNALDRNQDGALDPTELASARLILYGNSFGGASVVKVARQLETMNIPVLLTVQIDSVGRQDAVIPANVGQAANLFQRDGRFIRGEPQIRAADPERTAILGNFRFSYSHKRISLAAVPWHKKILRADHARMDADPQVWADVETLILALIR